jgi:DNA-directed RNA polymerase sigma subunit (sigma70/sigma32)
MAENKIYRICIDGQSVEISHEIYRTYHRMGRRERYLEERDIAHGKAFYSRLDDEDVTGEDMIPDCDAVSVEEAVETLLMVEKLRECIALLHKAEQDLINALFFANSGDGMTEREYSARSGIPQQTVNDRRRKILRKLRNLMDR